MYYASLGALALILHLIINHGFLRKPKDRPYTGLFRAYRAFLHSVMAYYVVDVLWGFLYETHVIPLAYTGTVLYFLSMVISVLCWTRVVVTYLNKKDVFSRFLTYAGWTIFTSELICLIVNFFYPIIFEFEANGVYTPNKARYITLALQVVLFFLSSVYSFVCAAKSKEAERLRYKTVGASGLVMSVFIVLQTMFSMMPFYSMGLLIGTSLIHIFVEEKERMESMIELNQVQEIAEKERQETIRTEKKNITFNRIAESLASNYDMIYYVDTRDSSYVGYTSNYKLGQLELKRTGEDFFSESRHNLSIIGFPEDRDRIITFLDREYLLTALRSRKQFNVDYRIVLDGIPQYTRLIVRKSSSGEHFIIAVENVDDEVLREKEQRQELESEKALARHDELTGTKNKTAYAELEQSVQDKIERDVEHPPFALVVCDINDLKRVNDAEGHKAGDALICAAARMLEEIFANSPLFRVGGDEFVVFLSGEDYMAREELIGRLRVIVFQNLVRKSGPVVAFGLATYDRGKDMRVSDVFERADKRMYENKRELKEEQV